MCAEIILLQLQTELVLSEYCSINYTQPELMKHEAWNYTVWWSASCAKMPLTEMKTGHCWLFLLESSRGKGGETTYCPLSLLIRSPLGSTWKTTWKNISWNVFGIQQVLFKNILSISVLHIFWPHAVASSPYGGTLGHRHQETLCSRLRDLCICFFVYLCICVILSHPMVAH